MRVMQKSLLFSVGLNVVFWIALYTLWFIWPLMPGAYPALRICELFDPGNQPYVAACSGWHGTAMELSAFVLNVLFYWLLIYGGMRLKALFTSAAHTPPDVSNRQS